MRHVWSGKGFKNAAGLIWLLEALGAEQKHIQNAYKAGSEVAKLGMTQPSQSQKIKEAVPWEDVKLFLADKKIKKPLR